jgi:hypothetical protein
MPMPRMALRPRICCCAGCLVEPPRAPNYETRLVNWKGRSHLYTVDTNAEPVIVMGARWCVWTCCTCPGPDSLIVYVILYPRLYDNLF